MYAALIDINRQHYLLSDGVSTDNRRRWLTRTIHLPHDLEWSAVD